MGFYDVNNIKLSSARFKMKLSFLITICFYPPRALERFLLSVSCQALEGDAVSARGMRLNNVSQLICQISAFSNSSRMVCVHE